MKRRGRRFPVLVAGAIVVLCTGIAAWWLWPEGETRQDAASTKRDLIKEVKPAAAPKAEPVEAKVEDDDPNGMPTEVGQTKNGYIKLPNGRLHRVVGVHTNSSVVVKDKYAIFDHPSENVLAAILTIEPGQTLVGTPDYRGAFKEDFLKSLSEPIIVKEDDPADVKEVKRALVEAKADLKAAYDRGEDIEDIVIRSREEFQHLAQYKQDLRVEVLKYAEREDVTSEDLDDFVNAANKMLEKKGIAPLRNSALTRIKLRMKEEWEERK